MAVHIGMEQNIGEEKHIVLHCTERRISAANGLVLSLLKASHL